MEEADPTRAEARAGRVAASWAVATSTSATTTTGSILRDRMTMRPPHDLCRSPRRPEPTSADPSLTALAEGRASD